MVAPVSGRMMHIVPSHQADWPVWSVKLSSGLSYVFYPLLRVMFLDFCHVSIGFTLARAVSPLRFDCSR